jgi:hypothetical protein
MRQLRKLKGKPKKMGEGQESNIYCHYFRLRNSIETLITIRYCIVSVLNYICMDLLAW